MVYYQMLENVHVILGKEQINFWAKEYYKEFEFSKDAGLSVDFLLEKELCKSENRKAWDSDFTTQMNAEKRAIAKNILRNHPSLSVQEVADATRLPIEQVKVKYGDGE